MDKTKKCDHLKWQTHSDVCQMCRNRIVLLSQRTDQRINKIDEPKKKKPKTNWNNVSILANVKTVEQLDSRMAGDISKLSALYLASKINYRIQTNWLNSMWWNRIKFRSISSTVAASARGSSVHIDYFRAKFVIQSECVRHSSVVLFFLLLSILKIIFIYLYGMSRDTSVRVVQRATSNWHNINE